MNNITATESVVFSVNSIDTHRGYQKGTHIHVGLLNLLRKLGLAKDIISATYTVQVSGIYQVYDGSKIELKKLAAGDKIDVNSSNYSAHRLSS